MNLSDAYRHCQQLTATHYENFPVGSLLIRKDLRPHVHAIYAFARTADDFADELALQNPDQALANLQEWDQLLDQSVAGHADHPIFIALAGTIRQFDLPPQLFHDLVRAFRQDVTVRRYQTMENVIQDYCRYSANPVGRLVLLLHGYRDEEFMRLSDAICTALQLTNFWQDIADDLKKDRIYLPQMDMQEFGVTELQLARHELTSQFQALLRHEMTDTRQLFTQGASLVLHLKGRLRWEIRATLLGGIGILDRIERVGYDVFRRRPQWSRWEMGLLFLKAIFQKGEVVF